MSVLIKGFMMPHCCDVCGFSEWSNLHQTAVCKVNYYKPCFADHSNEFLKRRSDSCPLVEIPEPHGRLIDADALKPDVLPEWDGVRVPDDSYSLKCVRNAPTVIEAEWGDDE